LHAWPEYGYCAIDLFTCAIGKDLIPLIQEIKSAFGADNFALRKLDRDAEVERFVLTAPIIHSEEHA
jgi:S-adenosylmethionine decarboxylase